MNETRRMDDIDDAEAARLLGVIRRRLVKRAEKDAERLLDEDDGERRVRTIASVVLALSRITEMEDQEPEGKSGDAAADMRRRRAAYIRENAGRIVELPEAEFERELAFIRKLETAESAAAERRNAGSQNGDVA